jgi:hypothetical protein
MASLQRAVAEKEIRSGADPRTPRGKKKTLLEINNGRWVNIGRAAYLAVKKRRDDETNIGQVVLQ